MKIELVSYSNQIFVDGEPFGKFVVGCSPCGKRSAIIRNKKRYGLNNYYHHNLEQAVMEIIALEKSITCSREFAEQLLTECEKCFNEPVLVERGI